MNKETIQNYINDFTKELEKTQKQEEKNYIQGVINSLNELLSYKE